MSRLNPYKVEVRKGNINKIIDVTPAEKMPQNWQILYGGYGLMLFNTKAEVKAYLQQKYELVKVL